MTCSAILRAIWEHTRLEAMRYVPMVPRKGAALLADPSRQAEMIDAFLRQRAHDNTIVDFTGTAIEDYGIAIYAALNWLNHCGSIVNADPQKFSGTLRSSARSWSSPGSGGRSTAPRTAAGQMLEARERPPLVFFLLWAECTNLAREIALAARVARRRPTTALRRCSRRWIRKTST